MNMSKKKSILLAAAILLVGLICLGVYLRSVSLYRQAVSNITLNEISISQLADGTYVGECDVNFIYANVEVTIQSGKISDIKLLQHKHDRGKAAEAVIGRIIEEQRINVDSVSGATNSSIVLKKAVEHALSK